MEELKEDPKEAQAAEGPSDEELKAAMVGILKDAKDDFSIKDLLNKLRKCSTLSKASVDKLIVAACLERSCSTCCAIACFITAAT